MGTDPRSTVGTVTDANALLRILFSRLGKPHIGSAQAFSFNVASISGAGAVAFERGGKTVKERRSFSVTGGMCPRCEGRGSVTDLDLSQLYDDSKSLKEGALTVPGYTGGGWNSRLYTESGFYDPDKPIRKFTKKELHDFLHHEPVNTNLATATGVMVWIAMDAWFSREKKPTFLGGVNGMICGLVGITPCAGWVNGLGAIFVGAICSGLVWVAWNYLSKVRPFSKVDDALGVIYTHGMAGLMGGLLLGIFGDPKMIEYGCGHLTASGQVIATSQATYLTAHGTCVPFGVNGLLYTGSAHQLWEQFRAAIFVIIWSVLITFLLVKIIGWILRGARYKDEVLEVGDLAIHGEEAFPEDSGFATRSDGAFAMAGIDRGGPEPEPTPSGGGA